MTNHTPTQPLLANRLIDLPEVTRITTLKKTKIYELIKTGELNPIKIGSKTVFSETQIQNWIAERIATQYKPA
jgi:excisionase family DNA binding protein